MGGCCASQRGQQGLSTAIYAAPAQNTAIYVEPDDEVGMLRLSQSTAYTAVFQLANKQQRPQLTLKEIAEYVFSPSQGSVARELLCRAVLRKLRSDMNNSHAMTEEQFGSFCKRAALNRSFSRVSSGLGDPIFAELVSYGGCSIRKTEERAVTVEQLQLVWRHIDQRVGSGGGGEEWRDWQDQVVKAKDVTLYVACEKVIMPATKPRACSYVELVAYGPQIPEWYVSGLAC